MGDLATFAVDQSMPFMEASAASGLCFHDLDRHTAHLRTLERGLHTHVAAR